MGDFNDKVPVWRDLTARGRKKVLSIIGAIVVIAVDLSTGANVLKTAKEVAVVIGQYLDLIERVEGEFSSDVTGVTQ